MLSKQSKINYDSNENQIQELNTYYIEKGNLTYTFTLEKTDTQIIIASKKYRIKLSLFDLSNKTKLVFDSIEEAYGILSNSFSNNKIEIKNYSPNKKITIKIFIYNQKNKEKSFLLVLNYDKNISELEEDYFQNKIENKIINPQNINVNFNLAEDSYNFWVSDNTFLLFFSNNSNILYFIYATAKKSIIFYNLTDQQTISEIKNAHKQYISSFRLYIKNNNKSYDTELIMSISNIDNNIKVWNTINLQCILNLQNINYKFDFLNSACFLDYNNTNIYIITSCNSKYFNQTPIKIFNLEGKNIKEINDSKEGIYFVDSFYDKNKYYIISGSNFYVKSYDFDENKVYQIYMDKTRKYKHYSVVVKYCDSILKLIESSFDGHIRVWSFHSAKLLNKINVGKYYLYGICLWDENYLFVGCVDNKIRVVDLKNGSVVKIFEGHNNRVGCLKKINHPKFGECLISQGWKEDPIKLWYVKK